MESTGGRAAEVSLNNIIGQSNRPVLVKMTDTKVGVMHVMTALFYYQLLRRTKDRWRDFFAVARSPAPGFSEAGKRPTDSSAPPRVRAEFLRLPDVRSIRARFAMILATPCAIQPSIVC